MFLALCLSILALCLGVLSAPANNTTSSTSPPFSPPGGLGTSPLPVYSPMSDFDFQSLNLALYQELLEVNLFHSALAGFSPEEFTAAGLNTSDLFLLQQMADQVAGHATVISNILGPNNSATLCNYSYPFTNVADFLAFSMRITQLGESGTIGFLEHLDSRASAQLLLAALAAESRQEMVFRQFQGLFPMPFWFAPAITQSMQWTLLAPFITSCPASNPHVEWQNFPGLNITNGPNATAVNASSPAISTNLTAPSSAGRTLNLIWETPGKAVGPDNNYTTNTTAGTPQFVAWLSQLNTTYTPLSNIQGNSGSTQQPGGGIFGDNSSLTNNGTIFVLVTDSNPVITPFNLSLLNPHVVAGPAIYMAG